MSRKSKLLNLSKKYPFLKKFYYFYNIFIRNYKFLKKGSQLGEDKIILDYFGKNFKGTFVDIGCYHPTRHNNTYELYKKGWQGINIDLNPLTIELFNYLRPRDININSAISDDEKKKNLYFIDDLNTQNTLEKNHIDFLKKYHSIKDDEIKVMQVDTKKLNNVLKQHNFKKVDFLNIDIEGHEINVLNSIDFNTYSFRAICIEMISHNDLSEKHNEKIKKILQEKNYHLLKKISYNYIYVK